MIAPRLKTIATLGLLGAALPINLAVTAAALARSAVTRPHRPVPARPRTVLISGGKMTKALQLCRSFHAAGHRVVLVETARYRLTGHRFSRAVDAFHVVPDPADPGYAQALLDVVRAEGVDVYVPVCSPVASYYDALAAETLAGHCEIVHADAATVAMLDDKDAFARQAAELGLPVPDTHRVTSAADVESFDFGAQPHRYVLKNLAYDPVNRLDLTPLPRPTDLETAAFAQGKPIDERSPWILQEFVRGTEYCTHSTVRDGVITVYACCESSAFQINYEMVDKPEIEKWVRGFVEPLRITGQVSFDFMQHDDGRLVAIECNPRTHSAITMFHRHPDLAAAYLGDRPSDAPPLVPLPDYRPTYWLYHEVWRLVTRGDRRRRLRTILAGRDAIFAWDDPLPFLLVHHLQIPSLLVAALRSGRDWVRIDFNIGKLVEAGGDLMRVLHLVGSPTDEFFADLSRLYAAGALAALRDDGREHVIAYVRPDGAWSFPSDLSPAAIETAPAMALPAAVARLGELAPHVAVPQLFCLAGMTTYRALLDVLGIPFVGNRAATMAIGAHKPHARAIVAAAGVAVADAQVVRRGERPDVPLPVVVKPAAADNSSGVTLVRDDGELAAALTDAFAHGDEVLVERYVELGREVRCGVIERDGELVCLPLEEYAVDATSKPIRDEADKLRRRGGDLELVAKDAVHASIVTVDDPVTEPVWAAARAAHVALGCRQYSLFDFRVDPSGLPVFLEASLYCSYSPSSVLAVMAAAAGIDVLSLFDEGVALATSTR